jgi:hypothetical protein
MNVLVEEIQTGTRLVAGIRCPIVDQLRRTARDWLVVRDVCNNVPRITETYRTEAEAREAYATTRLDGRKPRAGTAASERVTLRLTPTERAAWEAAAARASQTVAEWIRSSAERVLRPRRGASEAPWELHDQLRTLLSSKLVAVFANGPDAINVLVVRGFKRTANSRISAAKVSARWKKIIYVQEIGYEPQ